MARGRCSERLAGAEAYLPILEALDSLLHRVSGESLQSLMKTVAPDLVPAGGDAVHRGVVDGGAPRRRAGRLAGADEARGRRVVPRHLAAHARSSLFLDDLHWADVSTIDILNYLAGRFADMRVLVLTTYRPAEMALAQHPFLGITNDLRSRGLLRGDRPRVPRRRPMWIATWRWSSPSTGCPLISPR